MASGFYAPMVGEDGALKFYLNGEWRTSASGKLIENQNPSKGGVAFRAQGTATALPIQCPTAVGASVHTGSRSAGSVA